jgi:integrase
MNSKKTFKPTRLVIPAESSKDQRWFLKVYAIDHYSGKLRLKKYYKILGNTVSEKKRHAKSLISEIDQALISGAVFNKPVSISTDVITLTLNDIVNHYIASQSHTRSALKRLPSYIKHYRDFILKNKLGLKPAESITTSHGLLFDTFLKSKGNLSNRSINNYRSYAKSIWLRAISDFEDIPLRNPFRKVRKLKTDQGRNVAYLPKQVAQLKQQHLRFPDLSFLAFFMYYSLCRTNEIAFLQVKHIGLYGPNQIYIQSDTSKNSYERHVQIPPPLESLLQKHKIREYPPDYYIFSSNKSRGGPYKKIEPQPHRYSTSSLGEKYRLYILNPLELNRDYTLYSWKHTGVINAHNAGVSDADIMQQTGHRSYESFSTYMKSLGLFAQGQYAAKIPEI